MVMHDFLSQHLGKWHSLSLRPILSTKEVTGQPELQK